MPCVATVVCAWTVPRLPVACEKRGLHWPASLLRMRIPAVHPLLRVPGLLLSIWATPGAQQAPDYQGAVRPVLAEHCFACHGPDARARKGRLRLDVADGEEGAYRVRFGTAAIRPGSLEESELWYRLTTSDEHDVMPPPEAEEEPLSEAERETIRRWIESGAQYETHWAFVAPVASEPPPVEHGERIRRPLDRFVFSRLERTGRQPSPRADRRTLVRRLHLDLNGLPPTLDEVEAFLADEEPGAYERRVDELLSRPQYGEHMARYWLDVVRFADTNGVHHDHYREMSPYRDWVIRAFASNMPYDRFVTDQLAGDLREDADDDSRIASGFLRLHMIIDRGTMLPEESLSRNVVDRVTALGTAFLGLTLQCASCHDHKYDPIRQRDFYQLYAFFNNLDAEPETGPRSGPDFQRGLQLPYLSFPTEEQVGRLEELERELAALEERSSRLRSEDTDTARAELEALEEERRTLRTQHDEVRTGVVAAMVMKERAEVRPAHILVRGDYDRPGERVERDTPAFLPSLPERPVDAQGPRTRLELAGWLVSGEHPLTARVAVNRFWQQLFGVGLVKTAEDLGTQGELPIDRELLDHLAVGFVASGWDVKELMRRLVTSATYQQSSKASPASFEADPENRLLARGSRFRLDAEVVRDQILASSGLLSDAMFGPSVKPPQPAGIWEAVTLPDSYPRTFEADGGEDIYRRSLYTFWKRSLPPPQMTLLDAPSRESCTARRERTNTPLQALLLLNEVEYLKAARHLAGTVLAQGAGRSEERLERIYATITSRLPGDGVLSTLLSTLDELERAYEEHPELAHELCGDELPDGVSAAELAAWTLVTSAIYNLDITRTRE